MTPERYRELELNGEARLLPEEMRDGWHFCDEFDGLCTQGEERNPDGSCHYCGFDGRTMACEEKA